MKIALVYDRINTFGGAEQVLLALHDLWPDAPIYTAVYHKKTAPWANEFQVFPSWLQRVPFAQTHHEWFPWLTPLAFESFRFDAYDVVISITSAEAKNIITKPETHHICYCLTPTRYLWSGYEHYRTVPGLGGMSMLSRYVFPVMRNTLAKWDLYAAKRPDTYIAISENVRERIVHYYKEDVAEVIYPPVDTDRFTLDLKKEVTSESPFITVGRFVSYKRLDLVIQACTKANLPLLVIGRGNDESRLRSMAGPTVQFITHPLSQKELLHYYQSSRAFVFAGEEDFGIVAGEAQACGKPVLCYAKGGMAEIVENGKTGITFEHKSVDELASLLIKFKPQSFDAAIIRKKALKFRTDIFKRRMQSLVAAVTHS